MKAHKTKVLVIGSHSDSGFSMINFTKNNFAALRGVESNIELLFTKPPNIFSSYSPRIISKKYFIYLDKFLLFAPYLTLLVFFRKINVIHVLDHSDSIYRFFVGRNCKFLLTIHDLFAIQAAKGLIPEVSTSQSGKIYQRLISLGVSRADVALAVSATTKNEMKILFPRVPTKVIHNFVNIENFDSPQFGEEHQIEKYFLILMNAHWRKDRLTSISAWKTLLQLEQFKHSSLKIIGNPLTNEEKSLISQSLLPRVSIQENLERIHVSKLYRESLAVINISKYEGFGLPVIEANIYGKICIYGGSAALREIAGPININWDLIKRQLITPELSKNIISTTKRRLAHEYAVLNFSAQKYVDRVFAVYRSL